MKKRDFLKSLGLMGLAVPAEMKAVARILEEVPQQSADLLAIDEDFWMKIRQSYRIKPDYINLENGYYCMLPEATLEHYLELIRKVNYDASWYMRTVQWENKAKSAAALAALAGCEEDELVITRNTTESLDIIIAGKSWEKGDEAVMALQDYGAMLNQFKLMERRYGIVNKYVSIPNHPKSDQELVALYADAITPKTKLLMICHMVNITGQVLPVRKICDMAHEKGVEVMVDGAHAFAQLDFSIPDLNCDYYGTSLHKWLSVPLGAGFLYVKKPKSKEIWPLLAEDDRYDDGIQRLNHTGTHPVHTDLAILQAINFHQMIGIERKSKRLNYLQHYWTSQLRGVEKVIINTPADRARHGAIGNVGVEGIEPKDLAKMMLEEYGIWTVAIDRPGVRGLRITPNVYTTTEELDTLVEAVKTIAVS